MQESGELDLETMKIQEKVQSIHDRTIKWTLKHPRDKWMSKKSARCTSQQKVDTTLYFYTSFNEHNTPYTVLESDNSESMPDVLH